MTDASVAMLQDILDRVTRIESACTPCQQTVKRHSQALNGRGGNSANPGLMSRVLLIEENQRVIADLKGEAKEAREDRRRTLLWFRVQMGLVLASLLAFLGMAGKYFFDLGG